MIHTGVTSTGCRRAARRRRSFTGGGRSRNAPGWRGRSGARARGAAAGPCGAVRATEDRLEIDDGRSVDGLERAHAESRALDGEYPDLVQPDGVRAIRRAGGEHAGEGQRRVAPGVNLEDAAVGLVEPGEKEKLVPHLEIPGRGHDLWRELDPRIRRAL